MKERKRVRMAFRPCVRQAFLEDRLVLNGGGAGVPGAVQAAAAHVAVLQAPASPFVTGYAPAAQVASAATAAAAAPSGSLLQGNVGGLTSNSVTGSGGGGSNQIVLTGPGSQAGVGSSGGSTQASTTTPGLEGSGSSVTGLSGFNSTTSIPLGITLNYSLYSPGTALPAIPTGPLPGVLGTPHSAIGYWGFTSGFANGFYSFRSSTMRSTAFFNSANRGYFRLSETFQGGYGFTPPTLAGNGNGMGTAGIGSSPGGAGGIGTEPGGIGTGGLGGLRAVGTRNSVGGLGSGGLGGGGTSVGHYGKGRNLNEPPATPGAEPQARRSPRRRTVPARLPALPARRTERRERPKARRERR